MKVTGQGINKKFFLADAIVCGMKERKKKLFSVLKNPGRMKLGMISVIYLQGRIPKLLNPACHIPVKPLILTIGKPRYPAATFAAAKSFKACIFPLVLGTDVSLAMYTVIFWNHTPLAPEKNNQLLP
jgi:hypothetical protein